MAEEKLQNLKYQLTRRVLAEEYYLKANPKGDTRVTVVSAYTSEEDFEADMFLHDINAQERSQEGDQKEYLKLGITLKNNILVPHYEDTEKAFEKALNLAKNDEDFKASRQEYYKWQEDCMQKGYTTKEMAQEMDQMILAYNKSVEKAKFPYIKKFATTIIPMIIPIAIPVAKQAMNLSANRPPDYLEYAQIANSLKDTLYKIRNNPIHTPNGDVLIRQFIKKGPMLMANVGNNKPASMFYASNRELKGSWFKRRTHRIMKDKGKLTTK